MSKFDRSGPGGATIKRVSDSAIPALNTPKWERRLKEARAKRDKLLSSSQTGEVRPSNIEKPKMQGDEVLKPKGKQESHKRSVYAALGESIVANPVPVLLVFFGAAGFGAGVILGLGLLIGVNTALVSEPEEHVVPAAALPQISQAMPDVPEPVAAETEALPQISLAMSSVSAPVATEEETVPDTASTAPDVAVVELTQAPQTLSKIYIEPASAISWPIVAAVHNNPVAFEASNASFVRSRPDLPSVAQHDAAFDMKELSGPQFFVHAPDGVSTEKLRGYISKIEATGSEVAGIGRESFRVSTTHLRYYSETTEEVAQAVARDLGIEARDFSKNVVIPGRIEIWVAGRPKGARTVQTQSTPKLLEWLQEIGSDR